jgi:ERCC4-type nuclease
MDHVSISSVAIPMTLTRVTNEPILFDFRDRDKKTGSHRWAEQTREKLPTETIDIVTLDIGDIMWKGRSMPRGPQDTLHMAEIKTVSDLINSMKEDHLQDQMARMMALNGDEPDKWKLYLFIIGQYTADANGFFAYSEHDWDVPDLKLAAHGFGQIDKSQRATNDGYWKSGFRPYAYVESYLASLQSNGIAVHICAPDRFGNLFATLFNRSQKGRHHTPSRRQPKILGRSVQAVMCLSDAITQKGAISLLRYFDNVQSIMLADVNELVRADDVGPVSAKQIFESSRQVYK